MEPLKWLVLFVTHWLWTSGASSFYSNPHNDGDDPKIRK
jgi:hypothetical protein